MELGGRNGRRGPPVPVEKLEITSEEGVGSLSPRKAARGSAMLLRLPGSEWSFGGVPRLDIPAFDGQAQGSPVPAALQTPEPTKCKALDFGIPPPAPCPFQARREKANHVAMAVAEKSVEMLSWALQTSSSCDCGNSFDHSIHETVRQQDSAALDLLLTRGSKEAINMRCGHRTPLYMAIESAQSGNRMVSQLLEHGACVSLAGPDGNTPLHAAAFNSSLATVELLLRQRADPNVQNFEGSTPLHLVCRQVFFANGWIQGSLAKSLLAWGSDPRHRDGCGLRPSDHAEQPLAVAGNRGGWLELREMLLRTERWLERKPALLIRLKGSPGNIFEQLPEFQFRAVVCWL